MRARITILLFLWELTGVGQHSGKDDAIINRLLEVNQLNKKTREMAWPSSDGATPVIYYDSSFCYIQNPGVKFLTRFTCTFVCEKAGIPFYKTSSLIDGAPFHMEVALSSGADTTTYDHNDPYVKCSSFEIARNTIPGLTYHAWQAMIVHEMFHVFQYSHEGFLNNAITMGTLNPALGDSLQSLYRSNSWYKDQVDQENALLLRAAGRRTARHTDSLIRAFLLIRKARREKTWQLLHLKIDAFETAYETLEGTARYMEAAAMHLSENDEKNMLVKGHKEPKWLANTTISDRYFYATGLNLSRLLDQLKPNYKTRLFSNPDLTLEDLLRPLSR